jgi:hypothetical protein
MGSQGYGNRGAGDILLTWGHDYRGHGDSRSFDMGKLGMERTHAGSIRAWECGNMGINKRGNTEARDPGDGNMATRGQGTNEHLATETRGHVHMGTRGHGGKSACSRWTRRTVQREREKMEGRENCRRDMQDVSKGPWRGYVKVLGTWGVVTFIKNGIQLKMKKTHQENQNLTKKCSSLLECYNFIYHFQHFSITDDVGIYFTSDIFSAGRFFHCWNVPS